MFLPTQVVLLDDLNTFDEARDRVGLEVGHEGIVEMINDVVARIFEAVGGACPQ